LVTCFAKRECFSKLFILFFSLFILHACEEEKKEPKQPYFLDTVVVKPKLIKYYFYPAEGLKTLTKLNEEFGPERKKIILALNRLDSKNIKRGDSLIVPDTVYNDIIPYSPFSKHVPILDSVKKFLIFSYPIQAFAAYEFGKLVRWGPTSLGKRSTTTPTGLFHTNWKSKETISTVDSSWILPWAFNLDNFEGVSMHQFDLPGYPASHACCRLLDTDAEWIFYWAEQWILTKDGEKIIAYGTPVIIYGKYDNKNPRPWKNMVSNPKVTLIKRKEIEEIIKPYIRTIIERTEERNSVITARELNR
jgi:hypothetical protein